MTFFEKGLLPDQFDTDETASRSDALPLLPKAVTSACSYDNGGLPCMCGGYVARYDGYCASCSHSQSFHW